MNSRRDSTDGPEDVDAAFAEIVASLEREGVGTSWPDEKPEPPEEVDRHVDRPAPVDVADEEDDPADHYVPPEPPPLPMLRKGTIAALALILLGVVLLVFPGLFGLSSRIGTPLALVVLCSGVGWLLLRLRNNPPPDSGWDDGAVL
ncbi:hypothetical protein GCM10022243_47430 [Saccharothrix violaceirubra]|uniref:DUF308 domain-containing protein n=1 Tax=Saccharothrix violaceirubra TaxID=413306 RepID=A0A7W7T6Z1_9PSEU|nr:hypothetical protein [Saccharothrix violaceirubra]MBB4967716.1 hypothetical protein [Saccharothrix violaceirubra]